MSIVIRDGAARRLVVAPGDRVRATGSFVRLPDGDWLDLSQVVAIAHRPSKGRQSVRLVGVDADALPDGTDRSVIPGRLAVTGTWHDGVIVVESLEPVADVINSPTATAGGSATAADQQWDVSDRSTHVHGLEELRTSGQIVRDEWRVTDSGALILRVAAGDVDRVTAVLAAQLPGRLHVVASRYTAAQLRDVESTFRAHADDWSFDSFSCTSLDADTQPYAHARLVRVDADLAAWADTLPDDLLTLSPAITPAE